MRVVKIIVKSVKNAETRSFPHYLPHFFKICQTFLTSLDRRIAAFSNSRGRDSIKWAASANSIRDVIPARLRDDIRELDQGCHP